MIGERHEATGTMATGPIVGGIVDGVEEGAVAGGDAVSPPPEPDPAVAGSEAATLDVLDNEPVGALDCAPARRARPAAAASPRARMPTPTIGTRAEGRRASRGCA
jgi:hypothetical protein